MQQHHQDELMQNFVKPFQVLLHNLDGEPPSDLIEQVR